MSNPQQSNSQHIADSLIPVVLERRAAAEPEAQAFTFVDYDLDPDGYAETLTWSELYTRVRVVAGELRRHGGIGDRVAILAPQSMDYVVGFLGALEAGMVAVPLSVPMFGAHDERVSSVLADCAAAAILTTTAAVGDVMPSVNAATGVRPAVVEVDALDYTDEPAPYEIDRPAAKLALLQYTSGSTGTPSGVAVGHENIAVNVAQIAADQFADVGGYPPEGTTLVSWLPFFHDLGLMLGIMAPVATGRHGVLTSPLSFLQKPSRWIRLLAEYPGAHSAAPNFAFDLAARRTSEADLEGLTLAGVHGIMNAAERVQPATVRRFNERFAAAGLRDGVQLPAYGLAEATLYVASLEPGTSLPIVRFDYEKLAAGYALRVEGEGGSEQVGLGHQRSTVFRVVDTESFEVCPDERVGEIWVHGANVAAGYWNNPTRTAEVFDAKLAQTESGTPEGPWMRTGDLGVISGGELFMVGRIKDLIIIDGRNHYPDDIESTVTSITGARTAAISVPGSDTEQLVVVAELRKLPTDPQEIAEHVQQTRRAVASAVSRAHTLRAADIVLVPQGAIPITTSGKTRRRETAETYRTGGFQRLGEDG
ncbi:fatty-acid--AMP ligase [Tsukamurella sp. 8F]|uniref:fatty-acid--AMP ligase n=1 Tax=unclassified Tsukamurella TaxID=2633480 RepID=UPI0023B91E24|nr:MULTISPECIES: fatty-acid--AMP ligase [unclassified Tsukamurella]MDF0529304.1 fatty-acid--AMP ligase [Tsukamurella sp. 8J]MDF0586859.1 fatty-acid--AMP ligase [Tsukamurella sp. 8F]